VLNFDASNTHSYVSGSGIWYDLSGYGNSGSLTFGPTFDSGSASGSIVFDGVDDYVYVPVNTGVGPFACISEFSVETWIYPTKNTGTQSAISKGNVNSYSKQYVFPRTDDGWTNVMFYLWTWDDAQSTLSTAWPSLNAWHHAVGVYDGKKMYIYIDGVLATSKDQTGYMSSRYRESSISIGDRNGYTENYEGKIGSVKIYNYGLSASEVSQSYSISKERFGL
jgi:hypothetical protein